MMELMKRLVRDEEGQGVAEYALVLVLIAVGVIAILGIFRDEIVEVFSSITSDMAEARTTD